MILIISVKAGITPAHPIISGSTPQILVGLWLQKSPIKRGKSWDLSIITIISGNLGIMTLASWLD